MKIGFIGLGMMGKGMAANLQKAGHQLVVHDLSRAAAEPFLGEGRGLGRLPAGARRAASRWCSPRCRCPADVEAVALGPNGLIEGMKPDTAFFDMSTNSVAVVRKINAAFAEKNLYMLDSPVSGGPSAAPPAARWRSGSAATSSSSTAIRRARRDGRPGRAISARSAPARSPSSCTTAPARSSSVALAEVMTMGIKAGVDAARIVGGGAPGRDRPAAHLRPARQIPRRQLRPGRFRAAPAAQGRVARGWARQGGRGADAPRQPGARGTDRGDEPRLGPARQPGRHAAAGRALRASRSSMSIRPRSRRCSTPTSRVRRGYRIARSERRSKLERPGRHEMLLLAMTAARSFQPSGWPSPPCASGRICARRYFRPEFQAAMPEFVRHDPTAALYYADARSTAISISRWSRSTARSPTGSSRAPSACRSRFATAPPGATNCRMAAGTR